MESTIQNPTWPSHPLEGFDFEKAKGVEFRPASMWSFMPTRCNLHDANVRASMYVFHGCCNACCAILMTNQMNCASFAPRVALFTLAVLAALACCVPKVQLHVLAALANRALANVPVTYTASVRVRVRVRFTLVGPRLCVASPARVSCSLRIFRCIGVCIFLASATYAIKQKQGMQSSVPTQMVPTNSIAPTHLNTNVTVQQSAQQLVSTQQSGQHFVFPSEQVLQDPYPSFTLHAQNRTAGKRILQ